MCLIVKKGTEVKIADKDIICYKYLCNGSLRSPIQGFLYEYNKTFTTKLATGTDFCYADDFSQYHYDNVRRSKLKCYEKGFHCFESKERAEKGDYSHCSLYQCTIPKGTKYIEDETGLICSEAIMINKIIEDDKE